MKITRKTSLSELMEIYPEAGELFSNRGLHCFGCALAAFETLEQGAKAHGMSDKEIDELVNELNSRIPKENSTKG